jgi:putative hydrolase of the HAD superfamily
VEFLSITYGSDEMHSPLPKAILLDLDDTIISFDHGLELDHCWLDAIRKHMPREYGAVSEEILAAIKERAKWYWSDPDRHKTGRLDLLKARQEIVSAALMKWNINDRSIAGNVAATYGEERDKLIQMFPDSLAAIELFRSRGIKLALITNGSAETQWSKIHRFHLSALFDCILVEGDLGFGKPEEEIYLLALKQLGVSADETWMIGDNYEWEVEAPQRLGIKGIWVDREGVGCSPNSSAQPYLIIRSLGDLLSVMQVG